MAIGSVIKRTLQVAVGLMVAGFLAVGAVGSYVEYRVESSPETQERLKLSLQAAEYRVDEDAGFFTKLGVLISAWWNSDELLAEAERDKALERQGLSGRAAEVNQRRFNDPGYSYDDDYYPETSR